MGRNIGLMQSRWKMEEWNMLIIWNHKCDNGFITFMYINKILMITRL